MDFLIDRCARAVIPAALDWLFGGIARRIHWIIPAENIVRMLNNVGSRVWELIDGRMLEQLAAAGTLRLVLTSLLNPAQDDRLHILFY